MELELIQPESKPTYCVNCEHYFVYYDQRKCKAHVITPGCVDPVTAVKYSPRYKLCTDINKHANCKDYFEKAHKNFGFCFWFWTFCFCIIAFAICVFLYFCTLHILECFDACREKLN